MMEKQVIQLQAITEHSALSFSSSQLGADLIVVLMEQKSIRTVSSNYKGLEYRIL